MTGMGLDGMAALRKMVEWLLARERDAKTWGEAPENLKEMKAYQQGRQHAFRMAISECKKRARGEA